MYVTRQITFLKTVNHEHYYFPTVKPKLPFVNASKKQNIPPHLPSHYAPSTKKPIILLSVTLGEQLQQRVSSAPTCVVNPITSTSLSRQQYNTSMTTMIQPSNDGELLFDVMKIWEDVTKEHFLSIYSTCNWCKTCSSNIKQQSWSKLRGHQVLTATSIFWFWGSPWK